MHIIKHGSKVDVINRASCLGDRYPTDAMNRDPTIQRLLHPVRIGVSAGWSAIKVGVTLPVGKVDAIGLDAGVILPELVTYPTPDLEVGEKIGTPFCQSISIIFLVL